jgi:hypothetical protein
LAIALCTARKQGESRKGKMDALYPAVFPSFPFFFLPHHIRSGESSFKQRSCRSICVYPLSICGPFFPEKSLRENPTILNDPSDGRA